MIYHDSVDQSSIMKDLDSSLMSKTPIEELLNLNISHESWPISAAIHLDKKFEKFKKWFNHSVEDSYALPPKP